MTSDWLTWDEAAELVGCPVATIDWYKRQGRIVSRGRRARSLERASVEEFAVWWRAREAEVEARRRERRPSAGGPPDPVGWASSREAAHRLGVSTSTVLHRVEHGRLAGAWRAGRLWVRLDDLEAHALEEGRWISMVEAAELAGVSEARVAALVAEGVLVQRKVPTRLPSVERASVEAYAKVRAVEVRELEAEAARRAAAARADAGVVWLDSATAALVLGVSATRVRQLAAQDRLPFVRRGGRLLFNRAHVEQVAAAREFVRVRRSQAGG